MHLTLNVIEGEGLELSERFRVGSSYPVFILTNGKGVVISRWTGYTGAVRFVRSLSGALSDSTTIVQRVARMKSQPSYADGLFLAKYYRAIGEHMLAAESYRQLQGMKRSGGQDFSFDVFQNVVDAAWKSQIDFADVLPVADSMISSSAITSAKIVTVARLMAKLARKLKATDRLAKYLQAGVTASAGSSDADMQLNHQMLLADQALYVAVDTAGALAIKKASRGSSWETNPRLYFEFATWCWERRINLEQAEMFARQATDKAGEGPFKAKHMNILAEICFARGKMAEAVSLMQTAIDQDPDNIYYPRQLERFQSDPE